MDRMRSSASAAGRGSERRGEYGNVDVSVDAAGWPLGRHGKDAAMEGDVSVMASEARRLNVMLTQEVEELIDRQPQFGFLKPCRQLEKHYANKREAIPRDCSGGGVHHSHTVAEAMAFEDAKAMQKADGLGRVEDARSGTMRAFLSCDGIELNGYTVKGKSDAPRAARAATTREPREVGRGRGHFHRNSGERIWRISSTRYSIHEKETHVDLVNPAATRFLMEMSPGAHASPPAVAVPFKWEDAPGRAKAHAAAAANPTLQLPPRLAAPRSDAAFSRQLQVSVISHPLAGLFPCIGANSPSPSRPLQHQRQQSQSQPQQQQPLQQRPQPQQQQQQQQQQQEDQITWMHYRASKSYGGVYQNVRKQSKSFSQPLASTNQSMGAKPRRTFSSELGSSGGASSTSTDPTSTSTSASSSSSSILHGSQQSSSSSRTYLSCELDASTPRTADSKSSSSASYESIGEDFDPDVDSSTSPRPPLAMQSTRHRRPEPKGLLKLCKSHGNCLRKSKSRRRVCSPEMWAPTLATYFQCMDVNDPPLLDKPVAAAAVPTSSGYLNSKGEPLPLHSAPDATPAAASSRCVASEGETKPVRSAVAGDGSTSSPETSPKISPKRPTRLPYKMPSVAEQEQGRSMSRHRSALSVDLQCASPVYAAALEMLSPAAVTLMASRRHHRAASRALPSPKPHRRVQFILSMCKTLKRVLFRQQPRRSVVGTRLMYHDHRAPTTFQFSKPN